MVLIMMPVPRYTVPETGQVHTRLWWGYLKEPLPRGADNIKMDLQEVGRETWTALV